MEKTIYVYIDIKEQPVSVGRLWSRMRRGRESASFVYDPDWLERPERFALEPALSLAPEQFHTPPEFGLFGAFGDSCPDRWGRMLMRRAERRRAHAEGRVPRALLESDCLLSVSDFARQGALRFKTDIDGPFLAAGLEGSIPSLIQLPRLLAASERLAKDEDTENDLKLLLVPGSSVGGARPKVSLLASDGTPMLAKFAHLKDEYDVILWEAVALTLAAQAGITTPDWRIEHAGNTHVLLLKRFDRVSETRLPFLSALSMLQAMPGETRSYLEIADAISRWGASPKEDRVELWKRIVFNVLVSNTDDHLRNHGFLYSNHLGWRLSPVYDLNPTPADVRPRMLSTSIDLEDATASIDLALETADFFGLRATDAAASAGTIARAISNWRDVAARMEVNSHQIGRMETAFEHPDSKLARSLPDQT